MKFNGLDIEEDIETLMGKMLKTEYTRLPLFDGDINNIIGIFHMRKANHLVRWIRSRTMRSSVFRMNPTLFPRARP